MYIHIYVYIYNHTLGSRRRGSEFDELGLLCTAEKNSNNVLEFAHTIQEIRLQADARARQGTSLQTTSNLQDEICRRHRSRASFFSFCFSAPSRAYGQRGLQQVRAERLPLSEQG